MVTTIGAYNLPRSYANPSTDGRTWKKAAAAVILGPPAPKYSSGAVRGALSASSSSPSSPAIVAPSTVQPYNAASSPAPSGGGGGGGGGGLPSFDASPSSPAPSALPVRADAPGSTPPNTMILGAVAAVLLVGGFLMMRKGMV